MKPASNFFAVFALCALWLVGQPAAWPAEPAAARVIALSGEMRAGGHALKVGDTVVEGEEISSGLGGRATLEFAGRTVVHIRTDSRLRIQTHRGSGASSAQSEIRLLLDSGAVDVSVAKQGAPSFAIASPSGNLAAVRGTELRARTRVEAMLVEVLEGAVTVAGTAGGQVVVGAGYGTQVKPAQAPLAPVRLLRAPDISGVAQLLERPVVRLRFAPLAGAVRYRIVAAADRDLREVIVDSRPRRPDMRILGLDDGEYFFGVRAIDALDLDGLEVRGRFRLKARPIPPAAEMPPPDAVLVPGNITFTWEPTTGEAAAYRFQLAADEAFATLLVDRGRLAELEFTVEGLKAGRYYWRVASLRAGGDQGPYSDPQMVTLRAPEPQKQ
jgi:hypothetical protein